MLDSLLQTKLYMPRAKFRLISRPRLLDKMDNLRDRKLCLVSAPAGFGKSTLLAEWIEHLDKEQTPLQATWLSLDTNDNDPTRFLTYFAGALQKVDIRFKEEIQPVIRAFQISSIKEIWEIMATQIASIASPFVLVLDDYHIIDNPVLHEGISFMLEKMPACMHLVISTRVDPPLPLSRLRVQSELVEVRVSDLRFSSEEVGAYLELWVGKKLSKPEQVELEARMEGWIAGLQLAALAMQGLMEQGSGGEELLSAFVLRLSGSTRFIMDYLVEEVLQQLPDSLRSFLLQTSILERLTAPLCNAVTQREDSQVMLDILEKMNLFLFPLDDKRCWYRYHPLFADLLRSFLQADQSGDLPELHERASAWCEEQGMLAEAVTHALNIPDPGRAARMMEKAAVEMLQQGEVNTVQGWSTLIADEYARQYPVLCVGFALAFIVSDKLDLVEHYLSLVSLSPTRPDLHAGVLTAYSLLAWCRGEYENALEFARQAEELVAPDQTYLRGVLALSSGAAYGVIGDDEAAFQSFQQARQISSAVGNRTAELSTLKNLGDLQMRRGQLHQAAHSYRQALELASIRDNLLLPVAAHTISALAQLLYEWNQLEEAEGYLIQGIELAKKLENPYILLLNLQNLARVRKAQGSQASADRLRHEAEQMMIDFPPLPSMAAQALDQQIRLCLCSGDTRAALRWANQQEQSWTPEYSYPTEWTQKTWARLRLAQGNPFEAIETLEHVLPAARAKGRWGVVIELLVLHALALALTHQYSPATASLDEALRLAEPEGYQRIFLDEGEPMARLLRMIYRSKEKGARNYEVELLEGLLPGEEQPQFSSGSLAGRATDTPVLIDPLTEREMEVLRMIAGGSSNQEIAEQLVVTLGTVKAHLSHIYTKLDVRSRTQAIVKAEQLQLFKS